MRYKYEIQAIGLLTLNKGVVISGSAMEGKGMDIDTVDKKLYFTQGKDISRANFDGSSIEVVVADAYPWRVRVDWKGRRIFWTQYVYNEISIAALNGEERRVLRATENRPYDLAVDSIEG